MVMEILSYWKIQQMQKELKVDVEKLSSTIRSKTCAEDPRPSAKNIGILGIITLSITFGSLVLMDIITLLQLHNLRNRK